MVYDNLSNRWRSEVVVPNPLDETVTYTRVFRLPHVRFEPGKVPRCHWMVDHEVITQEFIGFGLDQ
jgi:hypothetical protein